MRADNCDFFRRENALTKGILTVALMKWAPFFHSHADKKMKRLIAKDRYIFFEF
jgi:hypothetical protein